MPCWLSVWWDCFLYLHYTLPLLSNILFATASFDHSTIFFVSCSTVTFSVPVVIYLLLLSSSLHQQVLLPFWASSQFHIICFFNLFLLVTRYVKWFCVNESHCKLRRRGEFSDCPCFQALRPLSTTPQAIDALLHLQLLSWLLSPPDSLPLLFSSWR